MIYNPFFISMFTRFKGHSYCQFLFLLIAEQNLGKICGEKIEGLDCGPVAGEWLEQALARNHLR